MYALLNIPSHTNCNNCGECCYMVMASESEIENIKKYIRKNPDVLKKTGKRLSLKCMFRDDKEKKCLIYPVRPLVCRLMGVTKGMECSQGNSHNIDGYKFFSNKFTKKPRFLNVTKWR